MTTRTAPTSAPTTQVPPRESRSTGLAPRSAGDPAVPETVVETARDTPLPTVITRLRALLTSLLMTFALCAGGVAVQDTFVARATTAHQEQAARMDALLAQLRLQQEQSASDAARAVGTPPSNAHLKEAEKLLAEAYAAAPQDRAALHELRNAITDYTTRLGATNAGKPGDAARRQAVDEMQRLLQQPITGTATRLRDASTHAAAHPQSWLPRWLLTVAGGLSLASLLAAAWVMARRTHRVLNVGITVAALLVGGATYASIEPVRAAGFDVAALAAVVLALVALATAHTGLDARAKEYRA